ncbi:hypothetical protein BH160DRAFT_0763 [Burkholderia sp. H160]|nr:hypothetical protein BH160DRAFT_0763 [Burkholderia sp. H160]
MSRIPNGLDCFTSFRPAFSSGHVALTGKHRKRKNGNHQRRLRNTIPRSTLQVPTRCGLCLTDHRLPCRVAASAVDEACGRLKQRRLR